MRGFRLEFCDHAVDAPAMGIEATERKTCQYLLDLFLIMPNFHQ